jgi:hypothetical protein
MSPNNTKDAIIEYSVRPEKGEWVETDFNLFLRNGIESTSKMDGKWTPSSKV